MSAKHHIFWEAQDTGYFIHQMKMKEPVILLVLNSVAGFLTPHNLLTVPGVDRHPVGREGHWSKLQNLGSSCGVSHWTDLCQVHHRLHNGLDEYSGPFDKKKKKKIGKHFKSLPSTQELWDRWLQPPHAAQAHRPVNLLLDVHLAWARLHPYEPHSISGENEQGREL